MSINLSKGERISLSKEAPGMKKAAAGLGWDVNASDTGSDFDLDVSVFMLGASGKIPQDKYFVFYNNLKSDKVLINWKKLLSFFHNILTFSIAKWPLSK